MNVQPHPLPQLPYWYDLGDVAVAPLVEDVRLLIRPDEFFPGFAFDPDAWYARDPWFDAAAGSMVLFIQSFVVCTPDTVLLVDACVGPGKERRRPQFDHLPEIWLDRFGEAGLRASDVDAVVFTHLHTDHVGAATIHRAGVWEPVFPHAPHYVVREEFDYWTSHEGTCAMHRTGDYIADSIRPIEAIGRLEFVAPDAVLDPRVRLLPAAGHTPGNLCVQVDGSAGSVVLAGDTMHHGVQVANPGLSTQYCVSRPGSAEVRTALLERSAETGAVLVPTHFPGPSAGRAHRAGAGYSFEFAPEIVRPGQFRLADWRARRHA